MLRTDTPRHRPPQGLYPARLRDRTRRPGVRTGSAAHRGDQHAPLCPPPGRRAAGAGGRGARTAQCQRRRPAARRLSPGRRRPDAERAARARHAADRQRLPAGGQHHAVGPVRLQWQLLHAVRGRGLSPHHLFPRPSRRDGDLPRHAARGQGRLSCAAVQRQSDRRTGSGRRPPRGRVGRPLPQAVLSVRDRRRQAAMHRATHHHRLGQGEAAAGLGRTARPRQDAARDGFADPRDPLGRAALRAGARSGPLHDRRRRRLQHGRDGEQGPEHLQHQVRAGQCGDRDRHRLLQYRIGGRPRVLPQLDRQPRDLPRLVPAVAEGRADGVPRPGILRRHDGAAGGRRRLGPRGQAHRGRARAAAGAVPRGRRPDGASGAARQLRGDQQLLHRDGVRERRRGRAHVPDPAGPRGLPQGHGPVFPAARRPGGDLRRLPRRDGRRQRPRSDAVRPLVQPGRHARGRRAYRLGRRPGPAHADADAAMPEGRHRDPAGHAGEAAVPYPLRARADRRRRQGPAAAARRRGRRGRHHARAELHRGAADLPLRQPPQGPARAAALAAAQLLGAGDRRCRLQRR
ncbi:hypothetical protein OJJOAM_000801 [Cupriavidus sp. H18C1]